MKTLEVNSSIRNSIIIMMTMESSLVLSHATGINKMPNTAGMPNRMANAKATS